MAENKITFRHLCTITVLININHAAEVTFSTQSISPESTAQSTYLHIFFIGYFIIICIVYLPQLIHIQSPIKAIFLISATL